MKKITALCASLLVLAGCQSQKTNTQTVSEHSCKTLNVYNWGEYISEDTIPMFEQKYGVKVNYSLYDSNEAMYTKLVASGNYDVIVPSDYMIERLIKENQLAKLDRKLITNFDQLSPASLKRDFDPNNDYSIPYFWGNVGIVYDKTLIDPKDVESQGWEVFKNPKYKGKIYLYDSERDSFMMAFKALGYSMNTESEEEIKKAYEWLSDIQHNMEPAYATDEAIDGLTTGEKAMGLMYNGDATTITKENSKMAFFVPKQGTNYWLDGLAIPKSSKCQELAHKFIDFMISKDIAIANAKTVGYAPANDAAMKELANTEYKDNHAFVPQPMSEKDEIFKYNEVLKEKLSELWIKVKNS